MRKNVRWAATLVVVVAAALFPFARMWAASPGDELSEKEIAAVQIWSDPWWQRVHNEPWCGPVEGITGCELRGEKLQELIETIRKPQPSHYIWGQVPPNAEFKYSVEVIFRDGSHRGLTVWQGMPAGTFYGVGPEVRVYRKLVGIWLYSNSDLAAAVERMLIS